MAAVSDNESNNGTNLPEQQHFLASLVNSFPFEWKGVLAALNSEAFPVQKASGWLEEQHSCVSVSDTLPHWPKLIDNLVAEFPVVLDNEVYFMPKVFLLPLNVQRNLLGFVHYHNNAISLECLESLVWKLEQFRQLDGTSWKNALRELLKADVRNKRLLDKAFARQGKDLEMERKQEEMEPLVHMNIMSTKSKQRFAELCEKIGASNVGKATACSVYSGNHWVLQNDLQENPSKPDHFEDGVKVPADGVISPGLSVDRLVMGKKAGRVEKEGEEKQPENLGIEIIEVLETPAKRPLEDLWGEKMEEPAVPCPPDELPEDVITEVRGNVTSLLSASLMAEVEVLRNCIQSLQTSSDHQNTRVQDLSQAIKLFISCTTTEMEEMCVFLGLRGLSEPISVLLCQQFVDLTAEPSYGNATIFAKHLLLPRLQDLTEAASRVFTETVCLFAKKHPRAFCDGVIINLLSSVNFAASQADVISKVVSDTFTTDVVKSMLEKVLGTRSYLEGSAFKWSEDVVTVILGVINLKLDIFDKFLFEKYACTLERQVASVGKSLKFPKLVLATITKYPLHVRLHHNLFQGILQNNDTFFKKAGIAALKKVMK